MSAGAFQYCGDELDVFLHARRWKAYWTSRIQSWVQGDVLEVGAGLGANTMQLWNPAVGSMVCLEPDQSMAAKLAQSVAGLPRCRVIAGTTASLAGQAYDCILYIDVLEHIEDDRGELDRAAGLLRSGGSVVVLSPAHQFLYSPFDRAIGHYRRYSRESLRRCSPAGCRLKRMDYLDSVGMALSLANRALLRQSKPSLRQILFWDRYIIPVSRVLDPILGRNFGKSVLGVWQRE